MKKLTVMNFRKMSTESKPLRYMEKLEFKKAATLNLFAQTEIISQKTEENAPIVNKRKKQIREKRSSKEILLKEHFRSLLITKKLYRRIRHKNYRKFFFPKITYKRFFTLIKTKLLLTLCKKNKIAALSKVKKKMLLCSKK